MPLVITLLVCAIALYVIGSLLACFVVASRADARLTRPCFADLAAANPRFLQ